jgi:hypothetical protein
MPVIGRDMRNESAMCAALASHLRSLVTYADLYRPEALRQPGSRAHSELEQEATLAHEGWGDRPVAASQQDLMLRVAAHLDHLIAYAMRVEHDFVTPFALESVARTAIECAARAAWLLDAPNAVSRVGRWAGDKIHSFEKEREAFGWLRPGAPTPKIDSLIAGYMTAAQATGVTIMTPPPYWQQVRDLLLPGGLGPNPGAFYAMVSAVAHGEEWGLRMFASLAPGMDPEDDVGTVDIAQTDRRVAMVAAYLLSAHEGLITRMADLLGRPPAHELWEKQLLDARLAIRPGLPTDPPVATL